MEVLQTFREERATHQESDLVHLNRCNLSFEIRTKLSLLWVTIYTIWYYSILLVSFHWKQFQTNSWWHILENTPHLKNMEIEPLVRMKPRVLGRNVLNYSRFMRCTSGRGDPWCPAPWDTSGASLWLQRRSATRWPSIRRNQLARHAPLSFMKFRVHVIYVQNRFANFLRLFFQFHQGHFSISFANTARSSGGS